MNKAGLIEKIADQSSVNRKDVEKTLDTMIETIITELLNGGKVNIVGFGSFEAKTRHARGGINPQKPTERITIPEVRVAKFKTGKTLKDALKGKISVKEAVAAVTAPVVEEKAASVKSSVEPKEETPISTPTPEPVAPVEATPVETPAETTPAASV
jgi:DNA-binding protein HU-beta